MKHNLIDLWLNDNWYFLQNRGTPLHFPFSFEKMIEAGFTPSKLPTENYPGKVNDWVLPLTHGRLHIWEIYDGALIAHWDEYNPENSIREMIKHCVEESPTVKALLITGAIVGGFAALANATDDYD